MSKFLRISGAFALLAVSFACAGGPSKPVKPAAGDSSISKALTRAEAEVRAHQVSSVTYRLWFGLDATSDTFSGKTQIGFELAPDAAKTSPDLWLDLEAGDVRALSINGAALDASKIAQRFDGQRIHLKVAELVPGFNSVEVTYSHPYAKDGDGFQRTLDPVDGAVYVYANFEPFYAHRMFPCFDQPDLKATYSLTVDAPRDWSVVANTLETKKTPDTKHTHWEFPTSKPFSTYLFHVSAGPYRSWSDQAGTIPIRLFARKSLAKYVDAKEWFTVTKSGLAFYGKNFGVAYPFGKYDQILEPDYNVGAMENVGAVTFSENFIYRAKMTMAKHRQRANVILHEMAHQWFGDLVTMKWWDDLWLNESFATIMASWSVDQATHFPDSWPDFFIHDKRWAYFTDQAVTTHPIRAGVQDTAQAFANFDGITYGKGASVLKQLRYRLGEPSFLAGLKDYFSKYAYRNTTLEDFIGSLAQASNQDLTEWRKLWLETSGVNSLLPHFSCANGKISEFGLTQGMSPDQGPLRPHRTQIALYAGLDRAPKVLKVDYSTLETAVPAAVGLACPKFVYANFGDEDYAKVTLDAQSLKFAQNSLHSILDAPVRAMTFHSLGEMVRDGQYPANRLLDLVLKEAPAEKDLEILRMELGAVSGNGLNSGSILRYLPDSQRPAAEAKLEKMAHLGRDQSPAGSDRQLIWHSQWADSARSPEAMAEARAFLSGSRKLKGLALDTEPRRWELIKLLAFVGAPDAKDLIAQERKRDPSTMGEQSAISAEASFPDVTTKHYWLHQALRLPGEPPVKISLLREAMWELPQLGQESSLPDLADTYFNALPRLDQQEQNEYTAQFARALYPGYCTADTISRTDAALQLKPALSFPVQKALRTQKQEVERCIRARALVESTTRAGS